VVFMGIGGIQKSSPNCFRGYRGHPRRKSRDRQAL
jgi:hypothetical protein